MPTNVNAIKKERMEVFRAFKRAMRRLDTFQEAAERKINLVLNRKTYAPTIDDYMQLLQLLKQTGGAHQELLKLAESAKEDF